MFALNSHTSYDTNINLITHFGHFGNWATFFLRQIWGRVNGPKRNPTEKKSKSC